MKLLACFIIAASAVATQAAAPDSASQGLSAPYTLTRGEVVALEVGAILNGLVAAAEDGGAMVLVSFSKEDGMVEIEIYAQSKRQPTVETAKKTIERFRKLLDLFILPRIEDRHDIAISDDMLSLAFMKGKETILLFKGGSYILGD